MERGGKSATGGATPLWLRRIARAMHDSQSGVDVLLCRRTLPPHSTGRGTYARCGSPGCQDRELDAV